MNTNKKNLINYNESISSELNEIWLQLFNNTPIKNVGVLRFYNDGSILDLNTDWKWIEHRLLQDLPYRVLFSDSISKSKKSGVYIWTNNISNNIEQACQEYGYWGGCNLYQIESDYIDVYSFVGKKGDDHHHTQNFCLNHLEELKKYILYFKSKMSSVFKKDNIAKIVLRETGVLLDFNLSKEKYSFDFYENMKIKKYIIAGVSFSQREYQCLNFLLKSYSNKQIARELNLSSRTIEEYIDNIKTKSNCSYKTELAKKYENMNEIIMF